MQTLTQTFSLMIGSVLLVVGTAHADEGRFRNGITEAEFKKAVKYEMQRRDKVDHAKNLDEFLTYATPEEIQTEFDIPDDEDSLQDLVQDAEISPADVVIKVNLASQTISMTTPTGTISNRVASGRNGYRTERIARPTCYRPRADERLHYSRKYRAPMPWSVFITGGYALHEGSLTVRSHGCVHLSPKFAKTVYQTVQTYGRNRTCILIQR